MLLFFFFFFFTFFSSVHRFQRCILDSRAPWCSRITACVVNFSSQTQCVLSVKRVAYQPNPSVFCQLNPVCPVNQAGGLLTEPSVLSTKPSVSCQSSRWPVSQTQCVLSAKPSVSCQSSRWPVSQTQCVLLVNPNVFCQSDPVCPVSQT